MSNQGKESNLMRFILAAIAIALVFVMVVVIKDKNQVKETPTRQWINPDGSLPYETVKALAPEYIDSLKRAGEIEKWLREHPQQNLNIHIIIEDERW